MWLLWPNFYRAIPPPTNDSFAFTLETILVVVGVTLLPMITTIDYFIVVALRLFDKNLNVSHLSIAPKLLLLGSLRSFFLT